MRAAKLAGTGRGVGDTHRAVGVGARIRRRSNRRFQTRRRITPQLRCGNEFDSYAPSFIASENRPHLAGRSTTTCSTIDFRCLFSHCIEP